MNIGKKIRSARKIKQITQEDLARAIGVSDKSISAYESERIHPPIAVLEKIADTTHHSLTYFLEDSVESSILSKLETIEKEFKEIKQLLQVEKKKKVT